MKATRLIVFMLVALSMLFSASVVFGGGEQEDDGYLIGAPMSSFSDKWQTYLQDGVRAFGDEYEDVTIQMTDGKDDPAQQLNQVETLLTQGADAIVIVPVDISAMEPIIAATNEAAVPLVVVNRLPAEQFMDDIDVFVGSESIRAGIMQAEWVAQEMQPEGGTVGIIQGPLGQEAARMRTEGNKQIFDQHDNIEVILEAEGKWDRAQGQEIAENWLQANPDLTAIVCNNDEMAIGALLAAEGMGYSDEDLIIAGVDATPDALDYLGDGLDVTVYQSAYGQGFGGAEAAYKLLQGESVEKMYWIPYELVTPQNKADYQ